MPAYVLSETLYSVLALGAAVLLWRALRPPHVGSPTGGFVLAGLVTGLAALVRPAELPSLAAPFTPRFP